MSYTQGKYEVAGTTVYVLEFDSWNRGKEQMRNRVYANVQGYRDTPKEEIGATAKLFASAHDMADMLDDLINTLANYRLLQRRSNDAIGGQVTTKQIEDIKALLKEAGNEYHKE